MSDDSSLLLVRHASILCLSAAAAAAAAGCLLALQVPNGDKRQRLPAALASTYLQEGETLVTS